VRKILIISFFLSNFLFGGVKTHILSDEACFDGKDIFLHGHVKISSSLGYLLSEKAIVTDIKSEKKDTSFLLFLEGDVTTHLNPNINVKSDVAKLSFPERSFSFSSYDEKHPTILTTKTSFKDAPSPLKVACQKMEFDFEKEATSQYPMKKFIFEENVAIDFDKDWKLSAHQVSFSPKKEDKDILFLTAKNENEPCKITYLENLLYCSSGEIDLQEKELSFEDAKGHLSSFNLCDSKFINFSSKKLSYEHLAHKLLFKDNVHINAPGLALIETDELQFYENQRLPQRELKKICLLGNSLVYLYDISGQMTSHLICDGSLIVDNELKTVSAHSSHYNETKFPIIYSDDRLTVHTQKALLKYEQKKNHYFPTQLVLDDGVHFFTKSFPEKNSFGIADSAILDPKEKLIRLIAGKEKRVFFWQEDDSLKLSAPEIQIKQMEDKSEYIQGVGDVRFSFDFDERKFLSEIFFKPLDKK